MYEPSPTRRNRQYRAGPRVTATEAEDLRVEGYPGHQALHHQRGAFTGSLWAHGQRERHRQRVSMSSVGMGEPPRLPCGWFVFRATGRSKYLEVYFTNAISAGQRALYPAV